MADETTGVGSIGVEVAIGGVGAGVTTGIAVTTGVTIVVSSIEREQPTMTLVMRRISNIMTGRFILAVVPRILVGALSVHCIASGELRLR